MGDRSLFSCPVCHETLEIGEKSYSCQSGHCFDIAAQGYVNLLLTNQMNTLNPGDDKGMVAARAEFLQKGYYTPLREALKTLCVEHTPKNGTVLDLGCGEGYYTNGIAEALQAAGKDAVTAGVDISKAAVKLAAKGGSSEFAVASVFHLPVAAESINVLINCFSPLCLEEIERVLKSGGYFIYVVPGAKHLWGLKCAVYDEPYENEEKETPYMGFEQKEVRRVEKEITLRCTEDIENLFRMTPYFWKTSKQDGEKLLRLNTLNTPIQFDIHLYRKL